MNQYNIKSSYDWTEIPPPSTTKTFECINKNIQPIPFGEQTTVLLSKTLPFYQNTQLIKLIDNRATPPVTKYALYCTLNDSAQMIDWTNKPIYNVNKNAPIQISKGNFRDYIRFFFSFVVGKRGRFFIVQTDEDMKSLSLSQEQSSYVQRNLPLHKVTTNKNHDFTLRSIVFFKNSLFETDINVSCEGIVLMNNETFLDTAINDLTNDWNKASKKN